MDIQWKISVNEGKLGQIRRIWTQILGQNGRRLVDYLQGKNAQTLPNFIMFKRLII